MRVTLDSPIELDGGGQRLAATDSLIAIGTDEELRVLRERQEVIALDAPAMEELWAGAGLDRLRFGGAGSELLAAPHAVDLRARRWERLPALEPALLHELAGPPSGQLLIRRGDWSADGQELLIYVEHRPPRGVGLGGGGGDGGFGPPGRLLWLDRARRVVAVPWSGGPSGLTAVLLGARWAAAGGRTLQIWDRRTRRAVATLEPHTLVIRDLALSGDEGLLASVGNDHRAVVVDTATWAPVAGWEAHDGDAVAAAFHPTWPLLATTGQDGRVRVWSTSGRRLAEASLGGPGTAVAFTPDGGRLIAATDERTLVFPVRVE